MKSRKDLILGLPSNWGKLMSNDRSVQVEFDRRLEEARKMVVDDKEPFSEKFLFCDQLGCTAQFGLTKQGINLFLAGANLSMFMIDIRDPDNNYIIDIDLDNFQTIYDKIISD